VRRRARSFIRWRGIGAGAHVDEQDPSVAVGGGGWHPGGVAVADLQITKESRTTFRFVVEQKSNRGGDLLLGITRCDEWLSRSQEQEALDTGYGYIMGRELARASIFYGGGSMRCCCSRGDGAGPQIDHGPAARIQRDARMARLSRAENWVDFELAEGVVTARDFLDSTFEWSATIGPDEVWQPTVAWTGSNAALRIVLQT